MFLKVWPKFDRIVEDVIAREVESAKEEILIVFFLSLMSTKHAHSSLLVGEEEQEKKIEGEQIPFLYKQQEYAYD